MGFFNPGLLWFALGGAIPVIIHLLHRQKFRRVRWAAMEFLLAALRKTQRRMRLESLLLLLLRILIMILLALAVARPFFHETPVMALGDTDAHHVFVIDESFSMGYKRAKNTSLEVAKKAAENLLKDIHPSEQDKFTLVTLSSYPESIQRSGKEQILKTIRELEPSHFGTSLHATMLEVKGVLDASKNRDRRVYVFTDMQRNGWEFRDEQEAKKFAALLKDLSSRDRTRFFMFDAGVEAPMNHAVVGLRSAADVVTTKRRARFLASVHNYSDTPVAAKGVRCFVDGALVRTEQVPLPARATTEVTFEVDFAAPGPHLVRVSLDPDYLDRDDHRHLALRVKDAISALVVDGEPGESARESETDIFVLALDPRRQAAYFSTEVRVTELFSAEGLGDHDFLVLANVQSLTPDKVEKIEEYVARGGGLLMTMGDRVDTVSFNQYFWKNGEGLSPAELGDVTGELPGGGLEQGTVRRIADFRQEHPVFRLFQGRRAGALYYLVFHRFFAVKGFEETQALARFDDPDASPLLLEKRYGEGKVLLWTSTLDHEWNAGIQGMPPWLPLMWDLCRYLAARPANRRNLSVGDLLLLDLPVERYHREFHLQTPDEGILRLSPTPPGDDERFFKLFYPARAKSDDPKILKNEGLRRAGPYRVIRPAAEGATEELVATFAVNVPPDEPSPDEIRIAESNLERIHPNEIRRMYPDFKVEFRTEKKEGGQEIDVAPPAGSLWKYLLYLLLGFLLFESTVAMLFGRAKH